MTDAELLHELSGRTVVRIGEEELTQLLETAEVLREERPTLAGPLRLLAWHDRLLFQEETPDRALLLRSMASREAAESLLHDRLATYERMWDGCGCHIDYFGEHAS